MSNNTLFKTSTLSAAIAAALTSTPIMAQDGALEEVIVTATRRASSVQDIPINITALSADMIDRERLTNLSDIAGRVPGMTVVDQGARASSTLTIRGLNVNSLAAAEALGNTGGETVGTYIGEIPLYLDLKTFDLERVEVLRGPQGTLYGSGTLGGAVRYIPNKPQADAMEVELRGDVFDISEADDLGYDVGGTINVPIIEDRLAVRASLQYLDDPGFIDYNFLVREPGVSNPQPDFSNPEDISANLKREEDANYEETFSGRIALRYTGGWLDGTLTYYYQDMDVGARQINHKDALGTNDYESAHRYVEPNDRENELIALELVMDLGFAELTSATGVSSYEEEGQRDQTDLLLNFEYGYEEFPSFAAFTREIADEDRFNQELRLVSTGDGNLNWIVGAFYNEFEQEATSEEFTPGFDQFAVDNFGGIQLRPDALEYYQLTEQELTEQAVFGEIGYAFTDRWQVTVGARYFEYEDDVKTGFDLPLLNTVFFGAPQDAIDPILDQQKIDDDGTLFKFNTSYYLTEDVMTFFTVSEGYRLGGANPVPACPDPLPPGVQNVCALPNEVIYEPDETLNFELGLHSQFGSSLLLNASLFYIEWDKIQIDDVTANGAIPIIGNGSEAVSQGVEIENRWLVTDRLTFTGTYAYTNAELTEDAIAIVGGEDAFDGDRLPGTPEHQGSLSLSYTLPMGNSGDLSFDWVMIAQSDVLTKVGERDNGETLPGFGVNNLSATWYRDNLTMTVYADNAFDKYAVTGVRADPSFVRPVGQFDLRRYYNNIIRPRQLGLRVNYRF